MGVNLGTAVGYLDLDTSKFTKGFLGAQKMLNGFNEKSFTGKLNSIGKSMSAVGGSMTKTLTAPIALLGATAIKSGASFESAMSQVAATMGKTRGEIQDLADAAVKMGSTTSFSATEAAEGLNYLALAGYSSEQQIAALPKVLTLAAAGNMDLAEASDMLTDSMSALGLASEDSEVLMNNMNLMVDQMAKTASQSNTSVAQLGEAILTVGGTAKDLAGGTVELNTVLGLMADNGIKASESGTHLRNILSAMTPTTEKAADAWEALGISGYDAEGNLRPLKDTFKDLNKAMEGMNMEQKTKLIKAMFNKTDLAAVNALLGTSSERWNELAGAIENSVGAGEKMQDVQLDNLTGDITLLKSAVEGLQIRFFELGNNALRGVVQHITNVVDWFNNLSDAQLELVEKIALIIAAIGPALLIAGKVVVGIAKVIEAMEVLKAFMMESLIPAIQQAFAFLAANPIVLAITAIIAAVALLAVAWKNDFGGIQEKTKAFIDFMKELPKKIGEFFKNAIEKAKEFVKGFVEKAKEAGKNFVSNLIDFIKELPNKIGYILGAIIGTVASFVVKFVLKAVEAGKNFVSNLINFFKNLPANVWDILTKVISKVTSFVKDFISKAISAGKNFLTNLVNGIKEAPKAIADIGEKMLKAIKDLPSKMLGLGKDIALGLVNGIKGVAKNAADAVVDFGKGIVDGFTGFFDIHSPSRKMKKEVGEQIANGVIEGIKAKISVGKIEAKKFSSELLESAKVKLENFKVYHDMSIEQEVKYWDKIRQQIKKGTKDRIEADKLYFSAKKELLKKEEELEKEREELEKERIEKKKEYHEKLKELDEEYYEARYSLEKDYEEKIDSLNKKYNDALQDRIKLLLSSFSLFEKYDKFVETESSTLTEALQSQVDALHRYNNEINNLAGRGILPEELLEEIRRMGVDATGQIVALNNMTDEELAAYVKLWEEKMNLAEEQAKIDLEPLQKQIHEEMETIRKQFEEEMEELKEEYRRKSEELILDSIKNGVDLGEGYVSAIASSIKNNKKSIKEQLDSINSMVKKSVDNMLKMLSQVKDGAKNVSGSVGKKSSFTNEVMLSGSHKQGLDYVPYDNYIARLHKGEAVLTAEENKARSSGMSGSSNVFNFYGTPPLDERETARQMKLSQQQLALKWT